MELKSENTEQIILKAAEAVFMKKGFAAARCTEIASEAGVNHAMLHYYYRTKESLFNRIFEQKVLQLLDSFVKSFDTDLPFLEKVKIGIEKHFDFLAQYPELPFFVISEVVRDKERKQKIIQKVTPIVEELLPKITQAIQAEVKKGVIYPVEARDLILNIGSLNVFSFVALQGFFDVQKDRQTAAFKKFLAERRQNNVEVIIRSLKKDHETD